MTKINLCRPPARQGEQERAREGKEGLAMRPDQAHLVCIPLRISRGFNLLVIGSVML